MACSPCQSSILQPGRGTAPKTPDNIVPKTSHPVLYAPNDPAIVYLLSNFMCTPEEPSNMSVGGQDRAYSESGPISSRHVR
eukprot:8268165-Alexandrium_andersonii.AAC.1